jgi:hypothetical protein
MRHAPNGLAVTRPFRPVAVVDRGGPASADVRPLQIGPVFDPSVALAGRAEVHVAGKAHSHPVALAVRALQIAHGLLATFKARENRVEDLSVLPHVGPTLHAQ